MEYNASMNRGILQQYSWIQGPHVPARAWFGVLCFVIVGLGHVDDAQGYWKEPSEVVEGTAYNLRAGEFSIGVFAPLQYGITDEFTLTLHPILELLLTPNVGFRAEVYEGSFAVNVTGSYLQTFLGKDESGAYPGRGEGGVIVSMPLHSSFIVSGFGGIGQSFRTLTEKNETFLIEEEGGDVAFGTSKRVRDIHSEEVGTELMGSVGVNWLFGPEHMLMTQIRWREELSPERQGRAEGTLQYAYAWERVRLSFGVLVGELPFRGWSGTEFTLPAYPMLDCWIRL